MFDVLYLPPKEDEESVQFRDPVKEFGYGSEHGDTRAEGEHDEFEGDYHRGEGRGR